MGYARRLFVGAALACVGGLLHGCMSVSTAPVCNVPPVEGREMMLSEYVVNPPDILLVELEPAGAGGKTLQPGDQLIFVLQGDARSAPISDNLIVAEDGTITIPPLTDRPTPVGSKTAGTVPPLQVNGLTVAQARDRILSSLKNEFARPTLSLSLASTRQLAGQYLVRPDGALKLGYYGTVPVAGLPLSEVEQTIRQHVKKTTGLADARVSVDVLAYNSMSYYVISDGGGYGDIVTKLPFTGRETVLDAVAELGGLPTTGSRFNIWVSRPTPGCPNKAQILPVDWQAITKRGSVASNYQLMPGDRLYVKADGLIAADTVLGKMLAPFERVLGAISLFSITQQAARGQLNTGNGVGAGS